ncbi:MAG: precorrin-2 C(20)-methyltransferase [Eubacteriales bacterium]|nr:precorrin-2 C(20)-methyltransferase [Eubacteriales bacterium]
MKVGCLYGIGVGPGDPELMTVKAVRLVEQSDVIVLPAKNRDGCYAYKIVKEMVPTLENKVILCKDFPMVKDDAVLEAAFSSIYQDILVYLKEGKKVAFLTIGDPSIYSTYMAMHKCAEQDGYMAEMISGVPSFCAVAARLGIALGEKQEMIHIIPGSYDTKEAAAFPGTRIYMKSGAKLAKLKEQLSVEMQEKELLIYSVSNCGMENERVEEGLEGLHSDSGYLTIVIVKQG